MPKRRGKTKRVFNDESMVRNAADEKQVKDAQLQEVSGRNQQFDDLKDLMLSPQGQRFFVRYMKICGIHKTSVTSNCETNRTFFLEGQRNIGLQLLSDLLEADPVICADILLKSKEGE